MTSAIQSEARRLGREVADARKPAPSVAHVVPRVREHVRAMVDRLETAMKEEDTERARTALQDVIGEKVTLETRRVGRVPVGRIWD